MGKIIDSKHTLHGGHLEAMTYKDVSGPNGTYVNHWAYNYQHPIGMVAVTLYNNSGEINMCLEAVSSSKLFRRWISIADIPSDLSICRYCLTFLRAITAQEPHTD